MIKKSLPSVSCPLMSLVSSASGRVAYREMAVDLIVIPPAQRQHICRCQQHGGQDGNPRVERTLLLVGTSVCGTGITSLSGGDDTGLGQQRVGQGRFAVVDMSNNTHVTNIARLLHEIVDLVDGEARQERESVKRKSPCFVVFLSPQGRLSGALSWSHAVTRLCLCGLPSTRVFGAAGGLWDLLDHFDGIDNETCLNDMSSVCLGVGGECLENGKIFCGGEGGEDRTPGRLKTRGFDLLIKEDCAGSLAAWTERRAGMLFGEEPQVRRKRSRSVSQEVLVLEGGVQWMGWVGPTESRRQGFALVGGGKKRGREEETGNVGAG